jgi:hypothetical protein
MKEGLYGWFIKISNLNSHSVTTIFKGCDKCNAHVPNLLALSDNGLSLLFQLSHLDLGHSRFLLTRIYEEWQLELIMDLIGQILNLPQYKIFIWIIQFYIESNLQETYQILPIFLLKKLHKKFKADEGETNYVITDIKYSTMKHNAWSV